MYMDKVVRYTTFHASCGHYAYCGNIYKNLSHLTAKYGKSPQKFFVDFHFAATEIAIECFDLVHISQHNGNYKMIPFLWYVICIGILLCWHANVVMFWGLHSHFGTQKNNATTT